MKYGYKRITRSHEKEERKSLKQANFERRNRKMEQNRIDKNGY